MHFNPLMVKEFILKLSSGSIIDWNWINDTRTASGFIHYYADG